MQLSKSAAASPPGPDGSGHGQPADERAPSKKGHFYGMAPGNGVGVLTLNF